jgi:signal transduction histidine kinase
MLNLRQKVLITLVILLFSLIIFSGYKYFQDKKSILINKSAEEKLLFYATKSYVNELVSSFLYDFEREKPILLQKHKIALEYYRNNDINLNIQELQNILNKNEISKVYDIYIVNDKYKIINSTLKSDIGFDLSFAKDTFLKHKKENIIGISAPIYETITKQFYSYSDSYIKINNKNYILQISYRYKDQKIILDDFHEFLLENKHIKSIHAYMKHEGHNIYDFPLLDFRDYKMSANDFIKTNNTAINILSKVNDRDYHVEELIIKDKYFRRLYIIDNLNGKKEEIVVILDILLDNSNYNNTLYNSKIFILGFLLFGILIILIVYVFFEYSILAPIDIVTNNIKNNSLIKDKELLSKEDEIGIFVQTYNKMFQKLKDDIDLKSNLISRQDEFVKNAIHEINTPLNIMLLNSELRERKYGIDSFTKYIQSAIKTIENTFQDLSYMMSPSTPAKIIEVNIVDLLQERMEYFSSISNVEKKNIILNTNINIILNTDLVDISRLIDNNISNAIKYSKPNTTITIKLYKNNTDIILSFHNLGLVIKNTQTIFDRYFREDNIQGGYGIGLHIVNTICNKYNYEVNVVSTKEVGTTFRYKLQKGIK